MSDKLTPETVKAALEQAYRDGWNAGVKAGRKLEPLPDTPRPLPFSAMWVCPDCGIAGCRHYRAMEEGK